MLDQVPLFSPLSADDLKALEAYVSVKSYRKNTVIIQKGDDANGLFVLIAGKVRVFLSDEEGKEVELSLLDKPGTYFGELALLGDTGRTASVITVEDSTFVVLSKQGFIGALKENPEIALSLVRDLVRQVRILTDKVGNLALNDVYGRVVQVLREAARDEAGRTVTVRLTQRDIARRVGASREMVSRVIKDLKAGGYLKIEGKRFLFLDKFPRHW